MERTCPRCGCTSFHYNRTRMRMECDSCGTPAHDSGEDRQLMQFDRTYAQAMEHLAAGNWARTIALMNPLTEQHPTERRLYQAILRAATKDFSDIEMADPSDRTTASNAWDKLARLGGVDGEMIGYSRRRAEMHRKELDSRRNRTLIWIFAGAFLAIFAGVCVGSHVYGGAVLCTFGLIACLYIAGKRHPIALYRKLSAMPDPRSNPFV